MTTRRTSVKGKTRTRVTPFKAPLVRTARYIYVEARGWFVPTLPQKANPSPTDVFTGPISFAECIVRAKSVGEAYELGAAAMDTLKFEDPTHGANHFSGTFLNDYAVKL